MPRYFCLLMFAAITPAVWAADIPENSEFFMVGTIASVEDREIGVAVIRNQITGATLTVSEGELLGPGRLEVVETIEVERIVIRKGQELSAIVRDPFPSSQSDSATDIYPEERFPSDPYTQGPDIFSDPISPDSDTLWREPLDEEPLDEEPPYFPPH